MMVTIAHHLYVLIVVLKLFQAVAVTLTVHSSTMLEVIVMDCPVLRMKAIGYCLAQCAQNKIFSNKKVNGVVTVAIICTPRTPQDFSDKY